MSVPTRIGSFRVLDLEDLPGLDVLLVLVQEIPRKLWHRIGDEGDDGVLAQSYVDCPRATMNASSSRERLVEFKPCLPIEDLEVALEDLYRQLKDIFFLQGLF